MPIDDQDALMGKSLPSYSNAPKLFCKYSICLKRLSLSCTTTFIFICYDMFSLIVTMSLQ